MLASDVADLTGSQPNDIPDLVTQSKPLSFDVEDPRLVFLQGLNLLRLLHPEDDDPISNTVAAASPTGIQVAVDAASAFINLAEEEEEEEEEEEPPAKRSK